MTGDESSTPAWDEYLAALAALYGKAGSPPSRAVALASGGGVSATTVADMLRGVRLSRWPVTAHVVAALGGDPEAFRRLWTAARVEATAYPTSAGVTPGVMGELRAIRLLLERIVERLGPGG